MDTMQTNENFLRAAMDAAGIKNNFTRAGIAAICMGESGFGSKPEVSYAHTSNDRIRMIFRSRLGDWEDEDLDDLKQDPEAFFEQVYGGMLGNDVDGDGYRYRGRGFIQLTGKGNYLRYGDKIGVDLVTNPDLADDPAIEAKIVTAYILDRYHGGGFPVMERIVGNSTPDIRRRKEAFYAQFCKTGEFNAKVS